MLLISIAGLGLGGYSLYSIYSRDTPSDDFDTSYKLVGLWEDVLKNKLHPVMNLDSAWLLEVGNEQVLNSEYVVLNQTTGYKDTRFHFIKAGLYRITINLYITDLLNTQGYALSAFKDGQNYGMSAFKFLFHVVTPNNGEHINVNFFLESNGTNFYEFGCYSLADPFDLMTDQKYNHISIDFVQQ